MTADTPTAAIVGLLPVKGATLYYEQRGSGPVLVLVGCPMDATAFAPLAERLADGHAVITTDPRGINRSVVDDPDHDVTPEMLADDLARLLDHLGSGPAAIFGSSGGAVTALAFAQAHPHLVHTVIAHEPPLDELLDDREQLRVETEDIVAMYLAGDTAGAWAKFLAQANIVMSDDELAGWPDEPDPQAAADEGFFFAHTLRPSTYWKPDLAKLRNGATRIVVGVGNASTGQSCDRTSQALATALTLDRVGFVGGHIGFVEHTDDFARQLLAALSPPQPTSNIADRS